jgi:hypothetical protein
LAFTDGSLSKQSSELQASSLFKLASVKRQDDAIRNISPVWDQAPIHKSWQQIKLEGNSMKREGNSKGHQVRRISKRFVTA